MTDFDQRMASHDSLEELLTEYVFGELDSATRESLEARIAADATLAAEVASLRRTLELLPEAVATEPPARLRERVLKSTRLAVREVASTTRAGGDDVSTRRALTRARVVGAVAATLAIAFGLDAWRVRRELSVQQDVAALLSQPNVVQSFELAGRGSAPSAFGTVALDLDAKKAAVVLYDLPQLQAGSLYRLWAIVGDKKVPCAEFDTTESGGVARQFVIPVDAYTEPVSRLVLTVEPASLPSEPVGPVVMQSS